MRLRWSENAIDDLAALRSYIEKDKPKAAKNVVKRILEAVELLPEQTEIGRPGRISGTRELVVIGTPYVVPYRISGEDIQLLRVFHGAMKWPEKM